MADDGSGADITIPSFLLYKPDADAVKAKLRETDFVQVRRFPFGLGRVFFFLGGGDKGCIYTYIYIHIYII